MNAGWPTSRTTETLDASRRSFDALIAITGDGDAAAAAVKSAAHSRLKAFVDGVVRYQTAEFARPEPDREIVWARGSARLLTPPGLSPDAPPVLLVPSLINRAAILDLLPEHSFLEALSGAGLRPFLLDWGVPPSGGDWGLDECINEVLWPAFAALREASSGRPVAVLGYCMGGLLALALIAKARRELAADALSGFVSLATPWDFHRPNRLPADRLCLTMRAWRGVIEAQGGLPVDGIQTLFAAVDPFLVPRKFAAFTRLDPDSELARRFIAVEDWVNDGVPLAAKICRQIGDGWYGANGPARGLWHCAGQPVDPAAIDLPSLVVVPDHDRIVPAESALPLAAALPEATVLRPAIGHVGMIVGRRAPALVWQPVIEWLENRAALQ